MNWRREIRIFAVLAAVFAGVYFLPVGNARFDGAVVESLALTRWYAREHVVLCLLPAFWIAGAIAVFVSKGSVMRYLGPAAPKPLAYGVASVSGVILAVCSCTVLPLFAGIHRMGAGIGPAATFLYSGPAINVLAIVLTAKVLGPSLGVARAVGAIVFSVVIGIAMALIFRGDRKDAGMRAAEVSESGPERPLWQTGVFFAVMLGVLVFANWGAPGGGDGAGVFAAIHGAKWAIVSVLAGLLGVLLWCWHGIAAWRISLIGLVVAGVSFAVPGTPMWPFLAGILGLAWVTASGGESTAEWFNESWGYTKQILPLLLAGVLAAGLLLGRPGGEGLVPAEWVARAVGGNSLGAAIFASVSGALMYFATLTEVPILQGLLGNGMGNGPALALLLAGPAVSLPNMLVINAVVGPKKTAAYAGLVVVMSAFTGWIYGALVPAG